MFKDTKPTCERRLGALVPWCLLVLRSNLEFIVRGGFIAVGSVLIAHEGRVHSLFGRTCWCFIKI